MSISAQILDAIETRMLAIATTGYGTTAGFSATAQAVAIPSGRFRVLSGYGELRDPELPMAEFDRGVQLEWLGIEDADAPGSGAPNDPLDGTGLRWVYWRLLVGHVYGAQNTKFVHVASGTTETAAFAVKHYRGRALNDAEMLTTALNWPDFVADQTLVPKLVDNYRTGRADIASVQAGKMITAIPFRCKIARNQLTRYEPSN